MQLTFQPQHVTASRHYVDAMHPGAEFIRSLVNEFIILKFYLNGEVYMRRLRKRRQCLLKSQPEVTGHSLSLSQTGGGRLWHRGHPYSSPAHFQSLNTLGSTGDCTLMYFCSTRCVFQTFTFQVSQMFQSLSIRWRVEER